MNEKESSLKLITKQDFISLKLKEKYQKYHTIKAEFLQLIESAKPLDVLALAVAPGSGLKILDVKILNEENEKNFNDLIENGIPQI